MARRDLLTRTYTAFNARDLDAALATLHPDVDWPNGMDGGRVHGHAGVRTYWTRQWAVIDPHVEPVRFVVDAGGDVVVDVHQVVRDHAGAVRADEQVQHVYTFDGDLVRRMEIRRPVVPLLANVDVDDLGRATEFYCTALGLRVGRHLGAQAVELLGASSPIYLLERVGGSAATIGTSQAREYQRHWTPVHLEFAVADVEAAVARACVAGAVLEQDVSEQPFGRLAVLADPFGHGFCLIQFSDRGYDALAS